MSEGVKRWGGPERWSLILKFVFIPPMGLSVSKLWRGGRGCVVQAVWGILLRRVLSVFDAETRFGHYDAF